MSDSIQKYQNLLSVFCDQVKKYGDAPYLWSKNNKHYHSLSWNETYLRVKKLASYLKKIGIKNETRVMLVSENRPEWQISDLAIMAADGISVPAYTTITSQDYEYLISHSEARVIIVSSEFLYSKIELAINKLKIKRDLIIIDDFDLKKNNLIIIHKWDEIQSMPTDNDTDHVSNQATRKNRKDIACIIYTSGTSGFPKGVILSHGSILHNCEGAHEILGAVLNNINDVLFLSWLPLSHSYEHTLQFYNLFSGNQIYYAESLDKLLQNLGEVRPHLMSAVPRFYESLLQKISVQMNKENKVKKKLFNDTITLGRKLYEYDRLSLGSKLYNRILSLLVRKKIGNRFGGRLVGLISGGAALNYDVGISLYSLGIPIYQGYGQTESGPVISVNYPKNNKIDTVGRLLPNTDVKISDEGEILVKGENVMNGYFKDPDATKSAFSGEWLKTGDVGVFDKDEYLVITDRMKDIIVNSGGDNISPTKIESMLVMEPGINQAIVYGDGEKYLVAIIVIDNSIVNGIQPAKKIIDEALKRVNHQLSTVEKVKNYIIVDKEFTVENGMMTPSMKIKRYKVLEKYEEDLRALYSA